MIAASLKRVAVDRARSYASPFRDHMIAASLKHAPPPACAARLPSASRRTRPTFRDHMIAASLKPARAAPAASGRTSFPRSYDRGLIEAASPRLTPAPSRPFPRSYDRGLIEAIGIGGRPAGWA